ncbi:hypothetical protein cypCar_00025068, partial [Cyprinus carpio]
MFPKGKSSVVPSDGQAREKLALYVYEYLLHIGAQKSAQTFLSESAAAAPSPVLGNMPPGDGMPGGPMPPGFFQPFMSPRFGGGPRPPIRMGNQPPGGVPAAQPMLPNMDPRLQGPMQRMNVPRGMGPMGPGPQSFGGGMRPPHNSMGPGMPGVNMGPGNGRPPWPNPNANNMPYSSPSPGAYGGPQGGGPPGTPGIVPSPADSNNSSENLYTMINSGGGGRNSFPIGPGSEGPLGAMAGMDPMHMNGGSGDLDGLPK